MDVLKLESRPDGAVVVTFRLESGETDDVAFTVERHDGITVGIPEREIFANSALDAEGVRAIVASVAAFDRVATYSSSHQV